LAFFQTASTQPNATMRMKPKTIELLDVI